MKKVSHLFSPIKNSIWPKDLYLSRPLTWCPSADWMTTSLLFWTERGLEQTRGDTCTIPEAPRSLNALRFLVYNAFRRSCEWRRARVGLRPSEHISNVMQATNSPEQQICIIPETHRADTEKQWTQSALINLKNTEKGYFRQTSNCCRVNISVTDGLCACFLIRMNSQTN